MHGSTSKEGTKAGGGRYSFSLLMAHRALQRILTATEQPQSLTAGEAENEAQGEFGWAKEKVSPWQGRAATQSWYYCPKILHVIFPIIE